MQPGAGPRLARAHPNVATTPLVAPQTRALDLGAVEMSNQPEPIRFGIPRKGLPALLRAWAYEEALLARYGAPSACERGAEGAGYVTATEVEILRRNVWGVGA